MDKDKNVTGRSTARRERREARNNRREEANIGQVLVMTPAKGMRETLATATALQRARAAALRKDREAALADEQNGQYHIASNYDATELKFRTRPSFQWTPAKSTVEYDTDADDEDDDEEVEYEDEKQNEPVEDADEDAEAIAEAKPEDADSSIIETPVSKRALTPTQSDLDFIATARLGPLDRS